MSSLLALSATAAFALTSSSFRMGPLPMHRVATSPSHPTAKIIATVHLTRARVLSMAADGEGFDVADGAGASEIVDLETPGVEVEEEQEEEEDLLSSPAFLKQKLNVLKAELEKIEQDTANLRTEAEAQREEWSSKRLRLQTDLENFQTRHKAQILDIRANAKIELIKSLLPMMDNFERARKSISPEDEEGEATNARYLQMSDALMATLGQMGVDQIPTVGTEFDYNLHMAIQQKPSEEYEEGIVSEEMQTGFTCKGKLIRPAYVIVSAGM